MDDATRKAIDKIEKLARLAEKAGTPEEAAAATAKYQELLLAYNLDMSVVEQNAGKSGKRLDEMVSGGAYTYQRELWQSIAQLNFCFYWTMKVRVKDPNSYAAKRKRKFTTTHRLVGRQVNVIATKNMAEYLEQTINRLCSEKMGEEGKSVQFYSSYAISFREGVADAVIRKIIKRRREAEAEERKRDETLKKAAGETSTATALTIAGLKDREKQANYDFLHGEGAWAKKIAQEEQDEKEWAKRQAAQAKAIAEAERAYAEWAAANPEEAAREAKKEAARERARIKAAERREANRRPRYYRETAADMRRESSAYFSGQEAGERISIDPQVKSDSKRIGKK
jgi:hypothetical protein